MRTIVTAITAAALALSLTFQAAPANAAVPGYDSSYAGESAFLNLDQGDSGSFTVFFANTGTTTWTTGSPTQVDLAACLEDKVTCNQQDADEAAFSDGWLSATRYATHTQTSVAPGQIGTFTYDVTVPDDAAEDTFRFNGALVLASTGADIHNEGYFQDVTTGTTPPTTGDEATLTELDPEEGTVEGGTEVTITGTDFDCTPNFPTVLFGDNEAEVLSCGATTLLVETPAGDAEGDVDVTVTNEGAAASNVLTFEYTPETVEPTFDSISVSGQVITLTFSEPVCEVAGSDLTETEIGVFVNGVEETDVDDDGVLTDSIGTLNDCDSDEADLNTEATWTISIDPDAVTINEGDEVRVTIRTAAIDEIQDAAGNEMERATTRTTTAEADTSAPTADSAEAIDSDTIEVTASETLDCADADADDFTFDPDDGAAITADAVSCDGAVITVSFPGTPFDADSAGELAYNGEANDIEDLSGNDLADFELDIAGLEAQGPRILNAELTVSAGFSGTADSGDVFVLTFDEDLADTTPDAGDIIRVQDEDGTIADIACTQSATDDDGVLDAVCTWSGADNRLTVTIMENTNELADDDDANTIADNDELVTAGDIQGLQWPATIIDTAGLEDSAGNDVNLADSDDVVIDDE